MLKNKFDKAMDYVDANIEKSIIDIKKGFIDAIGYNSNQFDKCFRVLTNESLYDYITERKLFFISKYILENKDKKLCDVAQDFGYSEQSVLNRVMKLYYNYTPGEIREKSIVLPNDKYSLADFQDKKADSRITHILKRLEQEGDISTQNLEYMEELYASADEYGFDIDTAYQIAELAEKLEVSVSDLMHSCFCLIENSTDYLFDDVKTVIHFCLESEEELDKICEFYQCRPYDLDEAMVGMYYKTQKDNL